MRLRPLIFPALAFCAIGAQARWMAPEQIPTERVVANLDAILKKTPNDHEARLTLARVHSLAYASHATTTPAYNGTELPDWQTVQNGIDMIPTDKEMIHLRKSLVNYNRVTHENPDLGLAWLGAGFMLEEASRWAHRSKPIVFGGQTLATKDQFKFAALKAYRNCFQLGLESDFAQEHVMFGLEHQWLTKEAGQSIMRLVDQEHAGTYSEGEKKKIQDAIKRSEERPTAITPILFPIDGDRPLSDLVNPEARTGFDLAGDKGKRAWPWITPRAAWLVWDPEGTGQITSGRQLFGTATWWMMFKDGFAALATLDDNRDGWLKGAELKGIAAWNDRNGNAKCEPGEVVSVTKWGVAAIKTSFDRVERDALTASGGIVMKDGRVRPAYDWVPSSER